MKDKPWTKCCTHYYCGPHEGQVVEFYKCNVDILMLDDVYAGMCDCALPPPPKKKQPQKKTKKQHCQMWVVIFFFGGGGGGGKFVYSVLH